MSSYTHLSRIVDRLVSAGMDRDKAVRLVAATYKASIALLIAAHEATK